MDREAIEEAIEVLEDASAEMLTETGNENYYVEAIAVLRQALVDADDTSQKRVDETAKHKHIKTWSERCEEHPDHQWRIISERMIQARMQEEIDELRQALAQPEHEPVYAFRRKGLDDFCTCDKRRYDELAGKPNLFEVTVFYTAPPKKEWVGLTAPEVQECYDLNPARFASRIEAKLKEKNGG